MLLTLNLYVEFPEDGVSDAETCRRDIILYLYTQKVHFLVS
jgi:hypothetical protein